MVGTYDRDLWSAPIVGNNDRCGLRTEADGAHVECSFESVEDRAMHIVFAVPECAPWARTGGVAEVAAALPKELVKLGHKVCVYLPHYRQAAKVAPDAAVVLASVTIPFPHFSRFVQVLDGGSDNGVQTYFVACPEMFDRESLYATRSGDYADNAERFGLFCRAVIEATKIPRRSGCLPCA